MGPVNNSFSCFSTNITLQLNTVYVMISPQVPECKKSSWESFTLAFNLTQFLRVFCSFRIVWQFMGEVILRDFNCSRMGQPWEKRNGHNAGYNGNREKKIWEVLICHVFHSVSTDLKRNVASIVALHFPLLSSSWNNFPSSMKRQNYNRFKVRELCTDLWSLCKFLLMGRYDPGNNQYFSLLS